MRQGSNGRRGRGRGSGRKPQNNRNQSFDSNGPSGRIRGTATQLHEKYLSLARDASASGDRINAENCYQHADHYYRIVLASQGPQDSYVDDTSDFDGDEPGYRQGGREPQGRDGGGREFGQQRRRMNGNGHDADGNNDTYDTRDDRDDTVRDGSSRDGGNRDGGNRDGDERRSRSESGAQRDFDGGSYDETRETRADDRQNRDEQRAAPRRNERRDDTGDETPRERRRPRRPVAHADRAPETAAVPDDAELRRALGGGSQAPAAAPDEPAGGPEAAADDAPEKPRRKRRTPSTRVSD
jgi:hypothetical protein